MAIRAANTWTVGLVMVAALLSMNSPAQAQVSGSRDLGGDVQAAQQPTIGSARRAEQTPIAAWRMSEANVEQSARRRWSGQPPAGQQSGKRERVKKGFQRAAAGAAFGVGGFFLGGMLGASLEGNRCVCDDPGLKGFLIGAPIGAVAGAIAGVAMVK